MALGRTSGQSAGAAGLAVQAGFIWHPSHCEFAEKEITLNKSSR